MNSQSTIVERRHRVRTGVLVELEDAAYRALRKYGLDRTAPAQTTANAAEESA
jgi:hypothetical protein